jgi:hypothetical protein
MFDPMDVRAGTVNDIVSHTHSSRAVNTSAASYKRPPELPRHVRGHNIKIVAYRDDVCVKISSALFVRGYTTICLR